MVMSINARQARWAEFLSQYNFQVQFRRGVTNVKADTLTRRTQDTTGVVHDRSRRLLGPDRLQANSAEAVHRLQAHAVTATAPPVTTAPAAPSLTNPDSAPTTTEDDALLPNFTRIHPYLSNPNISDLTEFKKLRLDPSRCTLDSNNDLLVDNCRWITSRDEQFTVLHDHHDTPPAGHPGVAKIVTIPVVTLRLEVT